jgi:undecaprenyl-diphosphatase
VDAAVLKALRSPEDPSDPLGPRWVELAAKDLTAMGSFAPMIAIVAASLGYLLVVRRRGSAAMLATTVALGFAWTQLLKEQIDRGRPEVVPHLVEVSTRSFPSGHATMSAVVYLTLGALLAQASERRRVKLYVMSVAVLATLVIGATRVYLGVHYPTDVLAGWALGAAWAAMAWLAGWALRRRRRVDSRG